MFSAFELEDLVWMKFNLQSISWHQFLFFYFFSQCTICEGYVTLPLLKALRVWRLCVRVHLYKINSTRIYVTESPWKLQIQDTDLDIKVLIYLNIELAVLTYCMWKRWGNCCKNLHLQWWSTMASDTFVLPDICFSFNICFAWWIYLYGKLERRYST